MKSSPSRSAVVFSTSIVLLLTFCALPTHAASKVWSGANSTDWGDGGNWIGGLPAALDDVLITNAANEVLLDTSTPGLTSLTISNNTLTCTNWATIINADTVTLQSNGIIAVPGRFRDTDMSNRVNIACTTLTIEQDGMIDVDEGGFYPWDGPGAGWKSTAAEGGAGYGGRGGYSDRAQGAACSVGYPYGDPADPWSVGSGGGSYQTEGYRAQAGGGGGAVRVVASGTVTVHGTITADGGSPTDPNGYCSGGSGGGIYISCDTFQGSANGLIRARGGNGYPATRRGGAGGGGRIALDYDNLGAQDFVRFSCSPGGTDWARDDLNQRFYHRARMGTLWLPDTDLLDGELSENQFADCRIMGPTSWSLLGDLSVSNCAVVFGQDGFELSVDGDIHIGTNGLLGIGHDYEGTNFTLLCSGSLLVTNGGNLTVWAGATNDAAFGHGAYVKVTNDISIGHHSWLYPVCESYSTNVASPRFVVGSLYVAAGGGIMADARGYAPAQGPGCNSGESGATYREGSGHGGLGGASVIYAEKPCSNGATYGNAVMPLAAGSGGSEHNGHDKEGGLGGGVIRVHADGAVTVNGTVSANGGDASGDYGGGASGGSIYIVCDTFGGSATGLIRAQGGSSTIVADKRHGAGGGGRIAIDYQNLDTTHDLRFSAAAGEIESVTANYNEIDQHRFRAQEGTLWFPDTDLLTQTLNGQFDEVRIFGPTSWSPAGLTVSNCTVVFAEPDFHLNVAGDVRVDTNSWLGIGDKDGRTNGWLKITGNLVVTNGGGLHVYGGATGVVGRVYGVLVKVTNDIAIGPDSWIYPYSQLNDGGSPKFECDDLLIASGGGIHAEGRGYGPYEGVKEPTYTSAGAGGGYGGRGGGGRYSTTFARGGFPYGDPHAPRFPGAGGGIYSGYYLEHGGQGGGLVWVDAAGTVTMNGTVNADGADALRWLTGAGAGGGIYITCDTFGGSADGLLTVQGGNGHKYDSLPGSNNSGGGGGGRIALDYNNLAATHDVRFSAAVGTDSLAAFDPINKWQLTPRAGTLSLPDYGLLSETLTDDRFAGAVSLWFKNSSEWKVQTLTVSNCWVGFGQDGFQLTVSNDLVVGTEGDLQLGEYAEGSNYTLAVGGSLVLTNGGNLHVFGGLTNAMGEGDVSALVTITNDLVVRAGSWVYPSAHQTKGGAPMFRMRDLLLDDGGGIDADTKGYTGKAGPEPGASKSLSGGGGGHGGRGGTGEHSSGTPANYAVGGDPYGLTNGPALSGSGGGSHSSYFAWSTGIGGGPVRIEARRNVTVDGTITASGSMVRDYYYDGGGAGGGIYIVCSNFGGNVTGRLRAEGSDAWDSPSVDMGGGGGGRISVWNDVAYWARTNHWTVNDVTNLVVSDTFANFFGEVSTTNGWGWTGYLGATPGPANYLRQKFGNSWEYQVQATPGQHDSPSPDGYGSHVDIPHGTWITNSVESPTDVAAGERWVTIGWDVVDYDDTPVNSGSDTQAWFQLTTNMTLTWDWTNQWLLTVGREPNGTVNSNLYNGWQTNAVVINVITAQPNGGFIFNGWIGDFPAGHQTDNPLSVTMDQTRSITATFAVAVIETNFWGGDGMWSNTANWSLSKVPKSIDHAVVTSGVLTIDTDQYVASLIVSNGASLSFTNWATKLHVTENVTVAKDGLITAWGMGWEDTVSNRVNIACSNLYVEGGGVIDVTAKGFAPWDGPGAGGGLSGTYQSGGAYGGRGGHGYRGNDVPRSYPYGTPAPPLTIGSGGGSYKYSTPPQLIRAMTGPGGGLIRIEASDAVTIDGTIKADGGDGSSVYSGGGSGGGIDITCDVLGGSNGLVWARGGNASSGTIVSGGGGGGRIAMDYNSLAAERSLRFSCAPAPQDWANQDIEERWHHTPRMGTLWLPDTNFLASPITDNLFSNCCIYVDGVTSIEVGSLVVSNASLTFPDNEFELRVNGDLTIGADGALGVGGYYEITSNALLAVGGSITLTNGGELHVYAGETNGTPGNVATLVTVTNDIVIGPSSWVFSYSQETNGGTPLFVAENLAIASGGGINAHGRGYRCHFGPGQGESHYYGGGGGHGGKGGSGPEAAPGGDLYDALHAPVQPGSGGGTHSGHKFNGGAGGGVVRVQARDTITVDGAILAGGGSVISVAHAGGGSGGSVWLDCDTFGGSGGLISANGGSSYSTNWSGAGGGGRIAVDYSSVAGTPTVAFSAAGGSNGWPWAVHAIDGRWYHRPQAGTLSLPDKALLSATLSDSLFAGAVRLHFQDGASWSPASLTVDGCAVDFSQTGFELTVAGDVRVDSGGLLGIGDDIDGSNYLLRCANLVVTNGGSLVVRAGLTNNSSQTYGTVVSSAQDIVIGPSSWIYPAAHRVNGATVLFKAGNVVIADGGGFNASGKGFISTHGPGAPPNSPNYYDAGGAGYGGRGGKGRTLFTGGNDWYGQDGGPAYGSSNAPVQPGSAGGTHIALSNWELRGGSGGGAVRIDARQRLTVRGTIEADGGTSHEQPPYPGPGSGGGIYLFCGTFNSAPSGLLSVKGGDAYSVSREGPGGGGRIAIWEGFTQAERDLVIGGTPVPRLLVTNDLVYGFNGMTVMTNGAGYHDSVDPPEIGTMVYLHKLPPPGTMILLR